MEEVRLLREELQAARLELQAMVGVHTCAFTRMHYSM